MPAKNTIEKIFNRLVETEGGCLVWPGATLNGYGKVAYCGHLYRVHVLLYTHLVRPVPKGYELHHRCRTKLCSNLEHLEERTHQEHMHLDDTMARRNSLKTTCPHGHEYSAENTLINRAGSRYCKACHLSRSESYRRRKGMRPMKKSPS